MASLVYLCFEIVVFRIILHNEVWGVTPFRLESSLCW